ncbi:Protein FIP2 [Linum perenne]
MSSPTTAAAAAAEASNRKVPPPCWTNEETVELIKAYRDKWFAVNRGNLRAADWDAVAAALADSPSSSDPPKTVVQCRHKIEKIRKRYRGEKQRCLKFPGRFFSSWELFPLLDSMEIGSIGSKQEQDDSSAAAVVGDSNHKASDGVLVRSSMDPDLDFDPDSSSFRVRKFSKVSTHNHNNNSHNSNSYGNGGFNESVEFAQSSLTLMPKNYSRSDRKPRRLVQMDDMMNSDERYHHRPGKKAAAEEWGNSSSRIRVKNPSTSSRSFDNGYGSTPNVKMNGGSNGGKGSKDPVAEVVSAIKMLREGFVMVEEMKMDMAMEIEKMRMGMELKHNQMLVEMQQDIVDSFAKACSKKMEKKKNKKMKVETQVPDSHRNSESGIPATGFEAAD